MTTPLEEPTMQPLLKTAAPSVRLSSPPSQFPTAAVPTFPPTLSQEQFDSYKSSLLTSDQNRDTILQTNEFVLFVNKESGGAFAGQSFSDIPVAFRLLFFSARENNEGPSILGSRSSDGATPEDISKLKQFCTEADRLLTEYRSAITSSPTASPEKSAVELLTDPELAQCRLFLRVSDGNQNSQLSEAEYVSFVNRLTINEFLGQTFVQLPLLFQDVFVASSGVNSLVSIVGVQPGDEPTPDQIVALEFFCEAAYVAAQAWQDMTDEPTQAPTGDETTLAPTIAVENFPFCKTSLAVSDRNRDDFLGQEEWVLFLNRMGNDLFLGLSFGEISPAFQSLFFSLRDINTGSITILGANPGQQQTPTQTAWLRSVCSETEAALSESTPLTPTSSPTAPRMTAAEFAFCKVRLSISDANKNKALSTIEYPSFLNRMFADAFAGLEFSDLAFVWQQTFTSSQSLDGSVSIIGAVPADDASPEEVAALFFFCAEVYDAFDANPTPPPSPDNPLDDPVVQKCVESLVLFDLDGDERINQNEYLLLVSDLSNGTFLLGEEFSAMPYVAKDNFDWFTDGSTSINIAGASILSELNGTVRLLELARLCKRTNEITASDAFLANQTDLLPHCFSSFTAGDADLNNRLDEDEYISTIIYFLGTGSNVPSFEFLDDPFRAFLNSNKGADGSLNVEGSKPGETPNAGQEFLLNFLCDELASSVVEARSDYALIGRCSDALGLANVNADNFLSAGEYTDFVYLFAERFEGNHNYSDLPEPLSENFNQLQSNSTDSIPVNGWRGEPISSEDRTNLDTVCKATSEAISLGFPSESPTQSPGDPIGATVLNGFVIALKEDIFLPNVDLSDIPELELAYKAFLNATVAPLFSSRRLRGRRLVAIGLSFESPTVYQLNDGTCPDAETTSTKTCMEAYASFVLLLSDNEGIESIVADFTLLTQETIANGALQTQLEQLSPDRQFDIVGVTASVVPDTQVPTASPGTATPTNASPASRDSDDGSSVPMIIGIIVGALVACACAAYFLKRRSGRSSSSRDDDYHGKTHGATDNERSSEADEDEEISRERSDSGDSYGSSSSTSSGPLPAEDNVATSFMPEASEHSRHEPKFNFTTESDHNSTFVEEEEGEQLSSGWSSPGADDNPEGWKDERPTQNSWSEGSEESELVDRTAVPVGASRLSRQPSDSGNMYAVEEEDSASSSEDASFGNDFDAQDMENFQDDEDEGDFSDEYGENEGSYSSYGSDYADDIEGEENFGPEDEYGDDDAMPSEEREEFRRQIEELVLQVVPDEVDNVDAMMRQFAGRETELIRTLSTMADQVQSSGSLSQSLSHRSSSYSSYHDSSHAPNANPYHADKDEEPFEDEGGSYEEDDFSGSYGSEYDDEEEGDSFGEDEEFYDE